MRVVISVSLSASLVLSSSISLADSAAAALDVEGGRATGLGALAVAEAPARVDRRFLASATGPEAAGLVAVRVVLVELILESLV